MLGMDNCIEKAKTRRELAFIFFNVHVYAKELESSNFLS